MADTDADIVSASDWTKGIGLSILASIIGGASKLAIRKSWLLEEEQQRQQELLALVLQGEEEIHQYALHSSPPRLQEEDTDVVETNLNININLNLNTHARDSLKRQNSQEEDTDSLRLRHSLPRSASEILEDDDNDMHDNDNDNDNDNEDGSTRKRKLLLARVLRGSGMIGMTLLNPLACVLAMNYASPSILAPFSGLTLVWIVLLSNPIIGEQPTLPQVMAACLIIFGEVIVAMFGDHTNNEGVTIQDVRDSYFRAPFLLYFAGLALWMLLMFHWMRDRSVSPTLKRFAWGISGGSITGLQNFLKDSLTIVKANNKDKMPGQGLSWFLPLLGTMAIVSAFSGLLLLTACMKRYDATYSSAMFVGSFVVSASIMSACHYNTFAHLESMWNIILYPAGLLILMGGVYMLLKETKEAVADDDDDDDDDDDASDSTDERSELETTPSKTRRREMEPLVLNINRII